MIEKVMDNKRYWVVIDLSCRKSQTQEIVCEFVSNFRRHSLTFVDRLDNSAIFQTSVCLSLTFHETVRPNKSASPPRFPS